MEDQKGAPPSNLPVIKKPEEIKPPAPSAPPSAPRVTPPPPPPPSAAPNAPKPPTGPLSSSFRTMASDLEAAKKGQSPTSSVLQIKPEAPKITTQEKPVEPPKPPPSASPLEVGLGKTEKAKSLFTPAPPKPVSPPPPPPRPDAVIIPPKKSSSKLVPLLIILLLILGGGAYWYFGLRSPEVVLSPTPAPEPTPSETPRPALAESFSATPHAFAEDNIVLAFSSLSGGKADFPALSFEKPVFLKPMNSLGSDLSLSAFMEALGVTSPEGFDSSISQNNWLIFYHGQKELFSSKGVRTESAVPSAKIGLVAEIQDNISLRSALNVWETTISADLDVLLGYSVTKAKAAEFLDNQYKGESIRYINFPYPDMSLDYAIVTGSDGANYLIISSSREGIYSIIDLLGSL